MTMPASLPHPDHVCNRSPDRIMMGTPQFPYQTGRPLIGRERELAFLQEHYAAALRGHASVILVEGEAGLGKTHLLRSFQSWVESQGAMVLYAACQEAEAGVPYGVVLRVLRMLLDTLETAEITAICEFLRVQPWFPVLLRLVPELADYVGKPPLRMPSSGVFTPGQIHEGVVQSLQIIARNTPVVLIFDDLHWADTATLELRLAAYRRLRSWPVLLVGSYRPEEVDQAHPLRRLRVHLLRLGGLRRLKLQPLEAQTAQRLMKTMWPDLEISPETWEAQTVGIPAFLAALARLHTSGGIPEAIPRSLRESNELLLSRMEEDARRVLETIAVLGIEADVELLATVSQMDRGRVAEMARWLVEQEILLNNADRYVVVDKSLVRVAYELLEEERRKALHARAGKCLEDRHQGFLEAMAAMLARHYEMSEQPEQALSYKMMAGAWARRLFALREARDLFWSALSLAVVVGDPRAQTTVHESLGEVNARLGDHRAALEHLHAALGSARSPSRRALIRVHIARSLSALGEYEQAMAALRQALRSIAEASDTRVEGVIGLHMAWVEEHLGNREDALEIAGRALTAAREAREPLLEADIAFLLALLHWRERDLDQARALCRCSLRIREQMTDIAGCALMWKILGLIERDRQDLAAARHCFTQSAEVFHRIGDLQSEAVVRSYLGDVYAADGALTESVEQFRIAFALYQGLQGAEGDLEAPLWTLSSFDGTLNPL